MGKGFSRITCMLEARYDFSQVENELRTRSNSDSTLANQYAKEELEYVAKSTVSVFMMGHAIDVRVLLGDVEATTADQDPFDQHQIPFTWDEVSLVHHPIEMAESLGRIKQFNYQTEDVIKRKLKTGLYSDLTQEEVDKQYLRFAEIKGVTKFHEPFTSNRRRLNLKSHPRERTNSSPFFFTAQIKVPIS